MAEKKILFITGSHNQTTQMHQVADQLPDFDCYFSQLYSNNPLIKFAVKTGFFDTTILAGKFRKEAEQYMQQHCLKNDYATKIYRNRYSLVVFCSDLLVPGKLRTHKTVFVQEGMTDPVTPWSKFVHATGLPAFVGGNTAFNGATNICDIYFAASEGYKKQFATLGTAKEKIFVTGIPNYDNIATFLNNDFPHHGYVLAATSDVRETFKKDNRDKFIADCVKIAGGRQLIFKLHPNENKKRAIAEIKAIAPHDTLIFTGGNTNNMIANCDELITQYSTVVYAGIALGKKVHSYFDVEKLYQLAPVQNGGTSAANIASICRKYIAHNGSLKDFLKQQHSNKIEEAYQ